MQKAYDTMLCDYVDADIAAKSGGDEPYRYECPHCWEKVHLCAANSRNQVPHFRHRSSNNNIECENYLGNRNSIIRNALYHRNLRDKIEFYFSSVTKMFSIGVKFNTEEIAAYEQNDTMLQIKTSFTSKPILTIPINSSRFFPDISELIPINNFSWEYYISYTKDSNQRKYEIFHKDKYGNLFPSFFKILANGDEDNFKAKLVRTETLYTNMPYLIILTQQRMFNSKHICLEFVSTFAFFYTDCLYYTECFDSCYHCVITFDNSVSIPHILNNFNRILSFFSDYTKYFLF